jgi:hypothetical protein
VKYIKRGNNAGDGGGVGISGAIAATMFSRKRKRGGDHGRGGDEGTEADEASRTIARRFHRLTTNPHPSSRSVHHGELPNCDCGRGRPIKPSAAPVEYDRVRAEPLAPSPTSPLPSSQAGSSVAAGLPALKGPVDVMREGAVAFKQTVLTPHPVDTIQRTVRLLSREVCSGVSRPLSSITSSFWRRSS